MHDHSQGGGKVGVSCEFGASGHTRGLPTVCHVVPGSTISAGAPEGHDCVLQEGCVAEIRSPRSRDRW